MNKFIQIAEELKGRILNNIYHKNTLLPSENALMEEFDVSRQTIRKSLKLLSDSGLIQTRRGKGSYILDQQQLNLSFSNVTSYHEVVESNHLKSQTITLSLEEIPIPQSIQALTGWPENAKVWHFVRLRTLDSKTVIVDYDYVLADVVPHLTYAITNNSTYRYFENELGLEIAYAKKDISVMKASAIDQKHLELTSDDSVIVIKGLVYLSDNTLFQYTESHHLLEKFHFTDFARRQRI